MEGRAAVAALASLLAAGCSASPAHLAVDLKTDLAVNVEFVAVQATLHAAGHDYAQLSPAFATDDFVAGHRVAELDAPRGDYTLAVSLLDTSHHVVVTSTTSVSLHGDLAVTIVLSRSCRGVTCPRASDPATSTACRGGVCVDPSCISDPSSCTSSCTSDAMCPAHALCAATSCVDGVCLGVPRATCGPAERCDPDLGCVPAIIACPPPLAACASVCTDVLDDPLHCGGCTTVCPTPVNADPVCAGGTCGYACHAGTSHCGAGCSSMTCAASFTMPGTVMYTVPDSCVQVALDVWGAGGGSSGGATGGAGGYASALVDVTPGEVLTVVVGAGGANGSPDGAVSGGTPGGGDGAVNGGSGGAYSGAFRGAAAPAGALAIAGGGGGAFDDGSSRANGGGGGGAMGENGGGGSPGNGGTQTMAGGTGDALLGGSGGSSGGGGGSGWLGGGGGMFSSGGGGGAGYVLPTARTSTLVAAMSATAGMSTDGRRAGAGDPHMAGLVIVTCP